MRICQPKGVRRVKEIQAYTTQRQRGKTEYLSSKKPPSVYLLSFTEEGCLRSRLLIWQLIEVGSSATMQMKFSNSSDGVTVVILINFCLDFLEQFCKFTKLLYL